MALDHEALMRQAIGEAELARGSTGDNPWVGCVIVDDDGTILARGHTLGPGEDHAEVSAARSAQDRGIDIRGKTLYSTLEPCSFHGRTPACSRAIAGRGIARVVIGMHDPHPRVDGEGIRILREEGVEVVDGVCEAEIRRQLGAWVLRFHPHEPRRRAASFAPAIDSSEVFSTLAEIYGVDASIVEALLSATEQPDR